MQNISSVAGLKSAIRLLESEQIVKEQLIKDQVEVLYESFRPVNLLKNTMKNIVSSPNLTENILTSVMSIAAGYFSKRIVTGSSDNVFRKIAGSILRTSVTTTIIQNSGAIKSAGQFIFQRLFHKND